MTTLHWRISNPSSATLVATSNVTYLNQLSTLGATYAKMFQRSTSLKYIVIMNHQTKLALNKNRYVENNSESPGQMKNSPSIIHTKVCIETLETLKRHKPAQDDKRASKTDYLRLRV